MEWIATKHALMAHLPVAAGLLLPLALIAALRPGRGIRPWWIACRYLGWAGFLGLLASLASGWANARALGLLRPGHLLPLPGPGVSPELAQHALWAAAGLPVAILSLWAMHRPRKEHQGFGILPLFLGIIWAVVALYAGRTGHGMVHPSGPRPAPAPVPKAALAPPVVVDPEAQVPVRALDYASLVPMQPEPLKSPVHGGRWIRVWVSESAVAAYRAGGPLPPGALVVMSTVEDRWGRPGPDPGPLYALEMKDGQPRLTFYWARVPADRQAETGGAARAYWRSPDPHLASCIACHAGGLADPARRSRWRIPRKPVETPEGPAGGP
ncbi:MAG TPA: hypothetical protein VF804_13260 [Holophagaceae bacterium]